MTIPDYQSLMRPLLALHADGGEHHISDLRSKLANDFDLTPEEVEHRLPSGFARTFDNRVRWAAVYLYKARLLDRPRPAVTRITDRGRLLLQQEQARIDNKVLAQFPEFVEFKGGKAPVPSADPPPDGADVPPQEAMETAFRALQSELASDLLERVLKASPSFFESLVINVLFAMGYGGSREAAAQQLGKAGDEGVDGVIMQDRLGLDRIYVQAKRWATNHTVGRPDIQGFVGALDGKRASKGIFITTSRFSREAMDYAEAVASARVVLIDGERLTSLMIEYGVGVVPTTSYQLKRLDEGYFEEEV